MALAILFHPLYKRLLRRLPRSTNLAALITLVLCLLGVILPLVLIGSSVVNETVLIYNRMSSGQLDFGTYFQQINDAMPGWIRGFLRAYRPRISARNSNQTVFHRSRSWQIDCRQSR